MNNDNKDWMHQRIDALHQLMASYEYKGFDPFDLSNASIFRFISTGWFLPQLIMSKFGARVASDRVRKILHVPPIADPKLYSCSYFGYKLIGGKRFLSFSQAMIDGLLKLAKRSDHGVYWGYDYTWATLYDGVNRRGASTLVPAAFAILALMHETLSSKNENYIPIINQALKFYAKQHLRQNTSGRFLGYFTHSKINTHNANLLGCAVLSLGAKIFGNDEWFEIAAEATSTTLQAIDPKGFLPYNDHPSVAWTDSFHHLYVIAAFYLIAWANPLVDHRYCLDAIARLRHYYALSFIREDGLINYYPGALFPIDCHNYAAAVIFSILFDAGKLMGKIKADDLLAQIDTLAWNENKQRYLHRRYKKRRDQRFFLRWNQVWMFLALCLALRRERLTKELAVCTTKSKFNCWLQDQSLFH